MYLYVYRYTHIYIHIYIYTCIYTYTHIYIYIYIYIYIIYIYIYMHVPSCGWLRGVRLPKTGSWDGSSRLYTSIHVSISTYICIYRVNGQEASPRWHGRRAAVGRSSGQPVIPLWSQSQLGLTYIHAHTYIYMYIYIYIYIHTYTYIHIYELRLTPGRTPPKDWIVGWFEQVIYIYTCIYIYLYMYISG